MILKPSACFIVKPAVVSVVGRAGGLESLTYTGTLHAQHSCQLQWSQVTS